MSATATTVAIASATVPSAYALTTTFTAPTQCAQSIGGLTMLENDVFRIWLNAPLPVPGTTISSCYPDQFMSSFLLQAGGVTQAPFEPLVCPEGYSTIGPFTSNYIACCPSGWDGFAPASDPPSGKPNSLQSKDMKGASGPGSFAEVDICLESPTSQLLRSLLRYGNYIC